MIKDSGSPSNELGMCVRRIVARRQEQAAQEQPTDGAPMLDMALDPAAMKNKYAAAMLKYIQENYAQRISLTDLSQELNISCTHLNAKFKEETGYTFHDFLNYYRIGRAVELQREGTRKMYEIAELVGFSDYKYFNKVYKKYVGYAPNKILSAIEETR